MSERQSELIEFAERELRARAEPAKAEPMAKYLKTDDPFFGVSSPERKVVLRALKVQFRPEDAEEYRDHVAALWARPHRETRYLAIDFAVAFKRFADMEALPLFERMIREGAWWDLVDGIATNLIGGLLSNYPETMTPILREWIDDDDMWIRRTALLAQNRLGENTDSALLFDFCTRRMHEKEFFIRKAIGWALRAYSYAAPQKVLQFLEAHRDEMSGLSYREGAKRLRREGLME